VRTMRCSRTEMPIAEASRRSCRGDTSASRGMVAGGSAPAGAMRALRRAGGCRGAGATAGTSGATISGLGLAGDRLRGTAPGTAGTAVGRASTAGTSGCAGESWAGLIGVARRGTARAKAIFTPHCMRMSWRRHDRRAGVPAFERRRQEIDTPDRHADGRVRRQGRHVRHSGDDRN